MAANIGTAYVTILPSFKGGVKAISRELCGIDASKAGKGIGKSLSAGITSKLDDAAASAARSSAGIGRALAGAGEDGATQIQKRITSMFGQAEKSAGDTAKVFTSAGGRISTAFAEVGAGIGGKLGRGIMSAGVDVGNLVNRIPEIGEAAKAAAGTMQAAFAPVAWSVARTLVKIGAVAAIGVATGIGATAKLATSASDTLKRFEGTMSFAGYSGKEIARAKKDMQDYADASVYDLHDVMNTAAQLGSNGVKGFDKVTQALGNLNMASGGNAQSFGLAAQQLVQMNAAGKVLYADWKVFAQDMPGASKAIQKELARAGAYQGNFNEAISHGQITAEEFNKAIISLGFTDAAKQAANAATTVDSAMGQIEASIEKAGQTVFDSLLSGEDIASLTESLTGAIDGAVPVIESFGKAAKGLASGFGKGVDIQGFTDALGGFNKAFGDAVGEGGADPESIGKGLGNALNLLIPVVREAAPPLGQLAGAIAKVLTVAAENPGAVIALVAGIQGLKAAQAARPFLESLTVGIDGVAKKAAPAADGAKDLGKKLGTGGKSAGSAASGFLRVGLAVAAIGAGVALASAGVWLIAQAAIQLSAAGPGAGIAMALMAAGAVGMAAALVALAPASTAASVGLLAIGAAVLLVGLGIAVAALGIAAMAQQLPTMAASGGMAAASMVAIGASALMMAPAALAAGAGMLLLGVGMLVAGAGALIAAAGVALIAAAMPGMAASTASAAAGMSTLAPAMAIFAAAALAAAIPGAGLALAMAALAAPAGALSWAMGDVGQKMASFGWGVQAAAQNAQSLADAVPMLASSLPQAGDAVDGLGQKMADAAPRIAGAVSPTQEMGAALGAASAGASALAAGVTAAASGASAAAAGLAQVASAQGSASAGFASVGAAALAGGRQMRSFASAATSSMSSAARSAEDGASRIRRALDSIETHRSIRLDVHGSYPAFTLTGHFDARKGTVPEVGYEMHSFAAGALVTKPTRAVVGDAPHVGEGIVPLNKGGAGRVAAAIDEYSDHGPSNAVYINNARVNADAEINEILGRMLMMLKRKGAM